MLRTADISEDEVYRYELARWWNPMPSGRVPMSDVWIMLNPSTADATEDDPTIRRCISFSQGWGSDGLRVVNLFALRSTDPGVLEHHDDPIGRHNDHAIRQAVHLARDSGGRVIAGWGAHPFAVSRAHDVARMLYSSLECLGLTKTGAPRHPLYVKGTTEPTPWTPPIVKEQP